MKEKYYIYKNNDNNNLTISGFKLVDSRFTLLKTVKTMDEVRKFKNEYKE